MIDDPIDADRIVDPNLPEDPLETAAERQINLTTEEDAREQRLDLFLVSRFNDASRSAIQRAITQGDITVNGKTVKPSYRLSPGETIEGEVPDSPPIVAVAEDIPLNIVYEDDEIIVIDKPAGMVTHPGAGVSTGTLANALVHHLTHTAGGLPHRGGTSRPGIVHRLDVGTSGLIVTAKTDRAHLSLATQFEARTVLKRYTALVYGSMMEETGKVDAPIGRDPRNRVKMAVTSAGRPALTLFRVLERFEEFSLLDVEIKTGRTHQIRVHLAWHKHPVVADPTYDAGRTNSIRNARHRAAVNRLHRPFLHAARLALTHPVSGERLEFTAPLPPELQRFLEQLRAAAD
ncbi:MAG: RluA family pseudouridine synthase [Blastocatellia bacterium]|nr:RluA family pseudouridine synthase [Blastocatellia bacterium]